MSSDGWGGWRRPALAAVMRMERVMSFIFDRGWLVGGVVGECWFGVIGSWQDPLSVIPENESWIKDGDRSAILYSRRNTTDLLLCPNPTRASGAHSGLKRQRITTKISLLMEKHVLQRRLYSMRIRQGTVFTWLGRPMDVWGK